MNRMSVGKGRNGRKIFVGDSFIVSTTRFCLITKIFYQNYQFFLYEKKIIVVFIRASIYCHVKNSLMLV